MGKKNIYHRIAEQVNQNPPASDYSNAYRYAMDSVENDAAQDFKHSEREVLHWLTTGQIDKIEQSLRSLYADMIEYKSYFSDDGKKQMEYSAIAVVSFFITAAVMSGLEENLVKAIRSYYFQKLSRADDIEAYYRISYQAMMDIAYIIKDHVDDSSVNPIINRAKEYIKANLSNTLSLENVAAAIGVSKDYFSKLFVKEMGKPFTQYLNEYKTYVASIYLASSNFTIEEIAAFSGFSSGSYLCKIFKQIKGILPKEYRRTYQTE